MGLSRNLENWLILNFVFIQCKTVKVSQIQMQASFPRIFLMNGTELRSFSHFQIFTKIAYQDLSRNLENRLILKFLFIYSKTVKMSQNDQIQLSTWFRRVFLMNGTQLRSCNHFEILTKITYSYLSGNPGNWLSLKFVFIQCKTVKISENDQI